MIPNMRLSEVKTRGIEPGGYIVRVVDATIDTKYNKLHLDVDIAEGDNKGYFTDLENKYNFWGLTIKLYLDEKSTWKFAKTVEAFRASNPQFNWEDDDENDERNFVGNYVGAICQRYHYYGNDGTEKSKLVVYKTVPVDDIRSGNYEVPGDSYSKDFQKMSAPTSGGVVDTTMDIPEGFRMSADDTPF